MIGEIRKINKDTSLWSVSLQENIKFDNDVYFKITNTCIGNDIVFGIIVDQRMNFINEPNIPKYYYVDKPYNEISISLSKTHLL